MNAIYLNFVNLSDAADLPQVVVFQKNEAGDYNGLAVAWRVITNVPAGGNFPFSFAITQMISASDSWGNSTPQLAAANGQRFSVMATPSGDAMQLSQASSAGQIEVMNGLKLGAINANIYRDGLLLGVKTGIVPGQKATFAFAPTIWIGLTSQVRQGQVINSAIISQLNTEISLLGIQSADIVLTGGGPIKEAGPFIFNLRNIVYA